MGFFDRFKRHHIANNPDANRLFLDGLRDRLAEMGYQVVINKQQVVIESQLTIAVKVMKDSQTNVSVLHLCLRLKNYYLPGDIVEHLMGCGNTIQEQVTHALDYFIRFIFLPIQSAFSESNKSDLDFMADIEGREILLHPKLGELCLCGEWSERPTTDHFFQLYKTAVQARLIDRKFNWLKIGFTKENKGELHVECLLNSEPWPEGRIMLLDYVDQLPDPQIVTAASQMIMFRLCDVHETLI